MGLGKVVQPKNKVELIRSIQSLYNPKIETIDVYDLNDEKLISKRIKELSKKGGLSVILVSDP
jgi:hypothetical protein